MTSLLQRDNIQACFIPFIAQDGAILSELQGLWVVVKRTVDALAILSGSEVENKC